MIKNVTLILDLHMLLLSQLKHKQMHRRGIVIIERLSESCRLMRDSRSDIMNSP